ncbi:MAG: cyclic nucleotide-binding domain-containing protein [Rhizobiaceae bacterium]
MAIEDDVRALAQVPLFQGFTSEQLRLIAFGTEHMAMNKGRELFREGESGDCGFLIVKGSVNLVKDRDASRSIVSTVNQGSLLGELALIAPVERQTGAVCATDCQVIRISRLLVRRVLDEYPDLAARLHAQLAANFGAMINKITKLERRFQD